jgi:hypothetical protein
LVEQGWDDGRFLTEETSEAIPVIMAVFALIETDELDRAAALTEAMLADAQACGSVAGFLVASGRRGWIALRRGELADAEADTRAALELATEENLGMSIALHAGCLGLTLLERGDLEQAVGVVEGVTSLRPSWRHHSDLYLRRRAAGCTWPAGNAYRPSPSCATAVTTPPAFR